MRVGLDGRNLIRFVQMAAALLEKPYPGVSKKNPKGYDGFSIARIQDWLTAAKAGGSLSPNER